MSGRRKNTDDSGAGEEAWLLPYADMITLLLGLFIVLFALSSIDSSKFDNVSKAFSNTFRGSLLQNAGAITTGSSGVLKAEATTAHTQQAIITQQAAQARTEASFDKEQRQLKSMAAQMQGSLKNKVHVSSDDQGLVIRVAGDSLFASGKYELKEPAISQLKVIAKQLKLFGAPLAIQGYTDGQPFNGPYGNWELSGQRAFSVLKLFLGQGIDPNNVRYAGLGATNPVQTPARPQDSVPANRRVEIHVLAPGKSGTQYTPEQNRAALKAPKSNIMEAATAGQQAGAAQAAGSSNWGGTATDNGTTSAAPNQLLDPIINASK